MVFWRELSLIGSLSGGQLQRALFARLLLQDAPQRNNAYTIARVLKRVLAKWVRRHGQGCL